MAKEKVKIDPELLRKLYVDDKRSPRYLSNLFGCTKRTISIKLVRYGIPKRSKREAYALGWIATPEHRIRISQCARRGTNHPHWKGGDRRSASKTIRESVYYRIWRDEVYKRDNWTCKSCNKRGGYLEAHHIKPFSTHPECRFEVNNGLTLCRKCHKDVTLKQIADGVITVHNHGTTMRKNKTDLTQP